MAKTTFLRRPQVEQRTGLSRSTIYLRMKAGTFPKPVKLGPRMVAWLETDIEAWQQECLAKVREAA